MVFLYNFTKQTTLHENNLKPEVPEITDLIRQMANFSDLVRIYSASGKHVCAWVLTILFRFCLSSGLVPRSENYYQFVIHNKLMTLCDQ